MLAILAVTARLETRCVQLPSAAESVYTLKDQDSIWFWNSCEIHILPESVSDLVLHGMPRDCDVIPCSTHGGLHRHVHKVVHLPVTAYATGHVMIITRTAHFCRAHVQPRA